MKSLIVLKYIHFANFNTGYIKLCTL